MPSNIEYIKLEDGNNYDNNNKFLFFFNPGYFAKESCCGCTVKTGAQIISIFYVVSSLSNFFSSFESYSDMSIFISGVIFLIYFTAAVCIFLSSMSQNYSHSYTAYLIYAVIFLMNLLNSVIMSLLILLGLYSPMPGFSQIKIGFYYLITSLLVLTIQLYFVWIVYSFAIDLKEKAKTVPIFTLEEPLRNQEQV